MEKRFNSYLTEEENNLIDFVLSFNYPYKSILEKQIRKAAVTREVLYNYHALIFNVSAAQERFPRSFRFTPLFINVKL